MSIREDFVGKLATLRGPARYCLATNEQVQRTKIIGVWIEKDEIGIIFDAYYENDGSESVSATLYLEMLFGEKNHIKIPLSSVRVKKYEK